MIFDLGGNERYIKIARPITLEGSDIVLRPICIGCEHQIEDGKEYVSNSSGSLSYHANGFCKEMAEQNELKYWKAIENVF